MLIFCHFWYTTLDDLTQHVLLSVNNTNKVSAYKSTINWDLGEKAKSISCVHTQVNPNKFQNHSYSLTSLLDQQPRDWLIDDYDSKHKGWRRTDQIIRNKQSFTKNSLYREQFPPKEAGKQIVNIINIIFISIILPTWENFLMSIKNFYK